MKDLDLKSLSFTEGNWDFDLAMNINLSFPNFDFGDYSIPILSGISFNPKGFKFPKIDIKNFSIPNINFAGFGLELYGIHIPKFNFDLASWTPGSIAKMGFNLDVKFSMPNLPNGTDEGFKFPDWDFTGASITDGNFSFNLPSINLPDIGFPSGLNIPMPSANGLSFNVMSFGGKLNTNYNGSLMDFLPDVNIAGSITLPDALQCENGEVSKIDASVKLNGNGSISGKIENIIPKCPINIGLASLYMKKSSVEFKLEEDDQKIILDGSAGIKFTKDPNQDEVGEIAVTYEVLGNEIIKAEGKIKEDFQWDLPSVNPALKFEIAEAILHDKKITIDGRSEMKLSHETMGVTFDNFTFDLNDYKVKSGQIIFDQPFAFSVTGLEDGEINFAAIKKGEIPRVENYLYFELPTEVKLDKDGFSFTGNTTAIINFQGKSLGDFDGVKLDNIDVDKKGVAGLSANFSDDFAFSLSPFKVSNGRCDVLYEGEEVAYISSSGFYPNANYFLNKIVPEQIPLPSLDIAYLQIKRNDNLLVNLDLEGNSTRFSTKENEPVELVFPSLQFEAATAPKILVNFSIAIDDVTGEVTDGYIRGVIPDESMQAFDLSQVGIPYAIKSIYYGSINGVSKFEFAGTPKLFDVEFPCSDSLKLGFTQSGVLEGTLNTCALNKSVSLIRNTDKLNLIVNTIAGSFSADIIGNNYNFDLTVDADIDFKMSEAKTYRVGAVLEADKDGVRLLSSRIPDIQIPKIDLTQFQIEMGNFSIGKLGFGPDPENPLTNKWDFSFGMDLDLSFPDLGLEIPNIPNVTLDMNGFHTMDGVSLPSFPDSLGFEFGGIEIKPLAFRMPKLDFNWFDPLNSSFGDGFKFDLEINFPNLADASGAMKYPKLSMINADFLSGIFVGDIELANFDLLDDMKLNLGGSLGFNIKGISGGFFDDNGTQGLGFSFKGDLELPDFMKCEGTPSSVDMAEVSFSLNSLGQVKGSVANFVPTCPIDLGFGKFNITSSSLAFDIAESKQTALLDMTGNLVVKTGENSTVTANGAVILDLLTGEITDGSITINNPFVWSIPNDKPVFSFTVNSALLNKDGLLINGGSNLNLPGNQQVTANFNQFLFDYRNLKVKSGNLTIDGGFALKLALKDGGIKWSAVNTNTELTENKTAMIGFTSDLTLDVNGLSINGDAIAKIKWDDEPDHQFGDLAIKYSDDFKFSLKPFKVSNGSADLEYENDIIATIDENGLSLGNIFGLLPIPENIPLPSIDIAYLKIKRGDNLLVQSESVAKGMRIYSSENSPVSLFLPALQSEGGDLDSIAVVFDVVINTTTGQIVDGAISIAREDSTSLINLRDRGIPVDLYKISYGKVDGNYELTADANIDIPNVLADFPINMHDIKINNLGLAGSINLGTYSETYNDELTPLQKASIGEQAIITLEGLDVAFGENFNVGFSGKFIPTMLINDTDTTQIQYAANWNGEESKFAFSFDFADGEKFDFGVGTFKPITIGENPAMKLSLTEEDFELLLNGEFKSDEFGDDFALTIEGLKITKNAVSANDISIPDVANALEFKLFNSGFKIFDVPNIPNSKAVKFTYSDGTLKLALSGELKMFDHTTRFSNFTIGTDGTFSIGSVNLLDGDLTIVENYLALNNLGITDNKLAVGGWAKLPKPVGNEKQFDFAFNIAADGTVTSNEIIGNKIVFFDEVQGIGGGDNTEYDFWKAKFDPTYLALNLNFDAIENSSVKMVADVYWDNNKDKRIAVGDKSNKNDIKPGLEIKFNGDVTWGTVSDLDDMISFKAEMLEVGMQSIALPTTTPDLSFSIGGTVGLNFDAVTGGLEIDGFEFDSDGIKDIGSIIGGTLEIVDVASLTLKDIAFSNTPTTIFVSGGSMPTESVAATTDSTGIDVNSYISFGGQITIEGLASGKVGKFLAYSTDNSNTLIIEDAHIKVDGTLDFNMDLFYHNGGDAFKIIAGGSGNIAGIGATIVGKFAKDAGKLSWGFFVAVDARIDMGPIALTGLGGGFFYNPTASDIDLIKTLAKVNEIKLESDSNEDVVGNKLEVQGGNFAIFLFAKMAVIDDGIIMGRALITITDKQFMFDGRVIMLSLSKYMYGSIHLLVQYSGGFKAEGNIKAVVNYPKVINGSGEMGFFVYSREQWGVFGNTEMKLFSLIEASSEFYVGNSGFLLAMETGVSIDASIVEINAGIDIKLWYLKNINWGAYAKAYIKAEVLWGAVTAKGWLKAALINKSNNTFLYGEAGLSVETFLYDWSGSVYATIKNGKASGGLGSDSEMQALIDEASNTSKEAEAERDAMKSSVENRAEPGVEFSENDLTASFETLNRIGGKYRYGSQTEKFLAGIYFIGLMSIETDGPVSVTGEEESYYNKIVEMYMGKKGYSSHDAPDINEFMSAKDELPEQFNSFSDARTELLTNFEETLEDIEGVGNEFQDISNPVTSFVMPTAGEGASKFSGSGFSLDSTMAQANETKMSNGIDNLIEYKKEVYNAYAILNSNIEKVDNTLRGSSGAEKFSETYVELRDKIDAAYHNEYVFHNRMMYWAELNTNGVLQDSLSVNRFMQSKYNSCSTYEDGKQYNLDRVSIIADLSDRDANSDKQTEISAWESNRRSMDDYQFATWGMNRSIELGGKLWSDIPYLGLMELAESSKNKQAEVLTKRSQKLQEMGNKQVTFTLEMDKLYRSLTSLYETKYDMVKMLLDWEQSYSTSIYNGTGDIYGYAQNKRDLMDAKSLLEAKMSVPTITKLEAKNYNRSRYAEVKVDWNTTGARVAFTNYLVSYTDGNLLSWSPSGAQAVGSIKAITFNYLPKQGQTSFNAIRFKLKAINEVGYSIHRSINFTPTFSSSSSGGSGSTTTSYNTDTTPPSMPGVAYYDIYAGGGTIPCETCNGGFGDYVSYYFVSDSTRLSAKWSSYDQESGIKEYRYKLNKTTLPESYNSQDQMNIDESSPESWTNNFQRRNVTINGLNIQHNDVYRIKVIAKNGDNLWSEIGGLKTFLVVDLTKPTTPTILTENSEVNKEQWASIYPTYNFNPTEIKAKMTTADINMLQDLPQYVDNFDNSEAEIELSWNASEDLESGIHAYQYQVSKIGNLNSTTEWISVVSENTNITLSNNIPKLNNMLNYVDSFKVVIRALNKAENYSEESEIILKINDNDTGIPSVSAHYTNKGVDKALIHFTKHAVDKESGIDHYLVRVGSQPNAVFDIISTEDAIKIDVDDLLYNRGLYTITIPQTHRQSSYIAVSAVNRNGVRGLIRYMGPFVQNALKPNAPYAEITVGEPSSGGNLIGSGIFVTSQKRTKFSKKEGESSEEGKSILISFTDRTNSATNEKYSVYYKISKQSGDLITDWTKVESNINSVANTLSSLRLENEDEIIVKIKSRNKGGYYSATRSYNYTIVDLAPADDNGKFHIELIAEKIYLDMEKIVKGLGKGDFGGSGFDYKVVQVGGGKGGFSDLSGGWVGNGQKSRASFSLDQYELKSGVQIQVILQGVNKLGETIEIESAPFMVP
jgi:hypothetical protein